MRWIVKMLSLKRKHKNVLSFFIVFVIFLFIHQHSSVDKRMDEWNSYRLKGPLTADDPFVIETLRQKFLEPPSSMPYNLSHIQLSEFGINELKGNEDIIIELFSKQDKGFFVEAGALDGQYLSNTLWLEKNKGWSGLLIEPNPLSYKQLKYKHRKAWTSNTCLSATTYPKETAFVIPKSTYLQPNKEFVLSLLGSTYEFGMAPETKSLEKYLKNTETMYVQSQCFPLYSYLLALNVSKIDFLSLDVQGSEMKILDSLLTQKVAVIVVVLEYVQYYDDKSTKSVIINQMKDRGFNFYKITNYNFYFRHKNFLH